MIALWAALAVTGLYVTVVASRGAVDHAVVLATAFGVSPFLIGTTLVAIGTDLPEIANSIVASLAGEGDLNVGDSIGSAATQVTLALGILPLAAGAFLVARRRVAVLGGLTVAALALGLALVMDGRLSRLDGGILVLAWVGATYVVSQHVPAHEQPELPLAHGRRLRHAALALGHLLLVAAGSTTAVVGIVEISALLGAPLYLVSFLGVSIGTSLPELVVDVTALRRGQADMAVGDIFGSSLVDATLSIGIGPLVAPVSVTAGLAVRGGLVALVAVGLAATVLAWRRRHTAVTGVLLLLVYAASYPVLLDAL